MLVDYANLCIPERLVGSKDIEGQVSAVGKQLVSSVWQRLLKRVLRHACSIAETATRFMACLVFSIQQPSCGYHTLSFCCQCT